MATGADFPDGEEDGPFAVEGLAELIGAAALAEVFGVSTVADLAGGLVVAAFTLDVVGTIELAAGTIAAGTLA